MQIPDPTPTLISFCWMSRALAATEQRQRFGVERWVRRAAGDRTATSCRDRQVNVDHTVVVQHNPAQDRPG